jgi:periplasmic protein TonB
MIINAFNKIKTEVLAIFLIGPIFLAYTIGFFPRGASRPLPVSQAQVYSASKSLPEKKILSKPSPQKLAPLPVNITPPQAAVRVMPVYPPEAVLQGSEGTVLLSVLVGKDGEIERVKQVAGSGHIMLDQAAEEALQKWSFTPARQGINNIKAWVEVPFSFKLLPEAG